MKIFYSIFVLIVFALLTVQPVYAYTCANPVAAGANIRATAINKAACTGTQWTVFTPAEMLAYNKLNTDFIALSAVVAAMPSSQPFDSALGAAFWSFSMVFVVGIWLVAKNAGMILSAIKRF